MWNELSDWEKRHNALVYGVLEPQDVRESLRGAWTFDIDNPDRVCSIDVFTDKESDLNPEDAKLINDFINKIKLELSRNNQ